MPSQRTGYLGMYYLIVRLKLKTANVKNLMFIFGFSLSLSYQYVYWWNNAWSIIGSTLDWNSALLLNSTYAGMASGTFSLRNAYLRIPVWSDKYPH